MEKAHDKAKLLERIKPYEAVYLYKYRAMNSRGLECVFTKSEIYLSDPTVFNDPFDCKPYLTTHQSEFKTNQFYKSIVKERFPNATKSQINKEIKKNPRFRKIKTREYLEHLYTKFIRGFGLYCLSEIPDDILMWSHYSDSHKGICLQFRADQESTLFWEAYKVAYQFDYPHVNIMEIGNWDQFFNALATKSLHWKYEQERRIIKTPDEGGPGLYKFEPDLLTGVILGSKISESDKKLILKWVSNYLTSVMVYEAELNEKQYRIDIPGLQNESADLRLLKDRS